MARIIIFIAIFGVSLIIGWSIRETQTVSETPDVTPTPFVLRPPSQALSGRVSNLSGEVSKQPRDKEGIIPIQDDGNVYQGERVVTGDNGWVNLDFLKIGVLSLEPNTEIDLSHLLPDSFLISQNQGVVVYQLLAGQTNLAVKTLDLAVLIKEGETRVSLDKEFIEISVTSGEAILGLVLKNNQTRTWHLQPGEKARIDNDNKTVTSD